MVENSDRLKGLVGKALDRADARGMLKAAGDYDRVVEALSGRLRKLGRRTSAKKVSEATMKVLDELATGAHDITGWLVLPQLVEAIVDGLSDLDLPSP